MKCLNCGTSVSITDINCPACRISLQKHGIIKEVSEVTQHAHQNCTNCGTSISSTDTHCSSCQMPAPKRKSTPSPSHTSIEKGHPKSDPAPGFNNGISAFKKEGFNWNTIVHTERNYNPIFAINNLNSES